MAAGAVARTSTKNDTCVWHSTCNDTGFTRDLREEWKMGKLTNDTIIPNATIHNVLTASTKTRGTVSREVVESLAEIAHDILDRSPGHNTYAAVVAALEPAKDRVSGPRALTVLEQQLESLSRKHYSALQEQRLGDRVALASLLDEVELPGQWKNAGVWFEAEVMHPKGADIIVHWSSSSFAGGHEGAAETAARPQLERFIGKLLYTKDLARFCDMTFRWSDSGYPITNQTDHFGAA